MVPVRGKAFGKLDTGDLVKVFNNTVKGLRAKTEVWCHTCWGNPAAQRTETKRRFYAHALPYFNELDVDVLTFEAAENGGDEIESFATGIGADKKLAVGSSAIAPCRWSGPMRWQT